MKKLMTMVAAVATSLGLFAAVDFTTSVNSDLTARNAGDTNIVGVDDNGTTTENIHWWDDAYTASGYESPAVVSNDTEGVGKYLAVETDGSPLLRTFDNVTVGQETAQYDAVNIADHGLFIQTKVCLTAFEDGESIEQKLDGNKLLVWLKATETENEVAGETNLMVTCGSWDHGVMTPVSYALDNVDVEPGQWVTLTIRADKDTSDYVPKFQIFVGEVQAKAGAMDKFPSLVGDSTELKATGFDGTGSVNFVNLLTPADAPAFAADPTFLTLTWDENVAAITIGGVNVIEGQESGYRYPIAYGSDISATITYKEGCEKKTVTATNVGDFEEAGNTISFKVARYAEATLDVVSKLSRDEVALTIDGEAVTETFASIKDVIAYVVAQGKTGSKIAMQLKLSEEASDFGDFSQLSDVTIDLAGNSLAAKDWAPAWDVDNNFGMFKIAENHSLTIKDTVGGGAISGSVVEGNEVWVIYNSGTVVLDESAEDPISYLGKIYNAIEDDQGEAFMTIKDGRFNPIVKLVDEYVTLPEGKTWSAGPDEEGFYTLVEAVDYVAQIGGDKYATLAEAFAAVDDGETAEIKLLKSCSGAGIFLTQNKNKNITLDLATYTYTCVGPAVGSAGTVNQAFHLEVGNTVTIKNGTLAVNAGDAVSRMIQGYATITLDGVTIDAKNLAANPNKDLIQRSVCEFDNGTVVIKDSTIVGTDTVPTAVSIDNWVRYDGVMATISGNSTIGKVYVWAEDDPVGQLATVTLAGGTIAEIAVDGNDDLYAITKTDATVTTIPEGYKWDDNGKLVKDEGKEIKPGEKAKDIEAKDAEEALSKVTILPINDEAAAAGQGAVIKGKATQDPESGKWTVEPVINEAAPEFKAPDVVVETTLEQIVAGTDGEEVTVALPAEKVTPGLYYSVDVATELGATAEFLEGERVLATSKGVSLTVTKPEGGKAFFKVSEHMAPTPANKD